jgi:chaperone BCS1
MESFTFEHNPFVSAGLLFMIAGGLMVYLRRIPGLLYDLIERFFIVKMEIKDEDEAYQWMQVWLADKLRGTLSISVVTKRNRIHNPDLDDVVPTSAGATPSIFFVPAVGTYFFWYRNRFVTLHRNRHENSLPAIFSSGDGDNKNASRDKESFTLRIFSCNRGLARQLIEDCRDRAIPDDGKLNIRVANYGSWSLSARVRPRPLASVVLDGRQAEMLLADMKDFLVGDHWYQETGVPYRRGYLLYGPPGNGKSSVAKALAGELGMSIYLLMLSDPDMNDNRINDLLARVPDKNMLLLEDIDCAFVKRTRRNGQQGGLTFAGLLNALDGVASPEGRIVVMTTNHLDRLDPALIRPGRADVKVAFENATSEQAERLFARFFPREGPRAGAFACQIGDREFSMASLQDYLMLYRHDPEGALRNVREISQRSVETAPPLPRKQRRAMAT